MLIAGATHKQTPDSVAKVSYWHIPNGADYVNATARMAYFEDMAAATAFAKRYEYPPEMAFLIPIERTPVDPEGSPFPSTSTLGS